MDGFWWLGQLCCALNRVSVGEEGALVVGKDKHRYKLLGVSIKLRAGECGVQRFVDLV
jgi:hypothetical protein